MNFNVSSRDPNAILETNVSIFYRIAGSISLTISIPLLYAILFHSGKTSLDYKNFLITAQILNISHDIVYNFSFAPVMEETYHVLYSSGGLMTYLDISMFWQFSIALFVRLQCAFCNFGALFYRHQIVQLSGSRWKLSPWKCILLAVSFNIFICLVFIPINIMSADQGRWEDIVRREFLPGGNWLLERASLLIVPRSFDRLFEIVVTNTLNDNRSMLSKSTKMQHGRAIAALRAQTAAPLIFVTIATNVMIFSNSIIPRLPWSYGVSLTLFKQPFPVAYILLLGLPSFQSITASFITIYFQASFDQDKTSYRLFFSRFLVHHCTSKRRKPLPATVTSSNHIHDPKSENVRSHH